VSHVCAIDDAEHASEREHNIPVLKVGDAVRVRLEVARVENSVRARTKRYSARAKVYQLLKTSNSLKMRVRR
jgi:ribosomal protein L19